MSDNQTHSSDPIDAEYEPVDASKAEAAERDKVVIKKRGPGWFAFFLVFLIALAGLGLSAWSSGLVDRQQVLDRAPWLERVNLPGPSGASDDDSSPALAALDERLAEVSEEVSALQTRLEEINVSEDADGASLMQLARLQDRTDALEAQLEQVNGDAGTANGESAAQPALETLRTQQTGITDRLDEMSTQISALDERVSRQSEQIDQASASGGGSQGSEQPQGASARAIDALQSQQSDLGAQVDDLSEQIATLGERLDTETEELAQQIETGSGNETERSASLMQLARLQDRMDSVESQLEELGDTPEERIDPDRIDAIEARLNEAGQDSGASAQHVAELGTEVDTLHADLETFKAVQQDFASDIENLRSQPAASSGAATSLLRASLALSAIETAAARGESFEAEYERLRQARQDDSAVQALARLSRRQVPTLETLEADLEALSASAAQAGSEPAASGNSDEGWIGSIFGDAVNVRRQGDRSETTATPQMSERLDEARAALERNNLEAAIRAVSSSPQASQPAFQSWLEQARQRANLESSLEDLRLKMIAEAQ